MSESINAASPISPTDVLAPHDEPGPSTPVWLVADEAPLSSNTALDAAARDWLTNARFTPAPKKQAVFPDATGKRAGVALGQGSADRTVRRDWDRARLLLSQMLGR